ncbi:hypothetical protein [Pontibacillus salipaludis]|uniref:hypothetical protein n=1 Tax=Pontibacillus salipaludis TaxID=1697394 RepID=UPI0031EA2EA1
MAVDQEKVNRPHYLFIALYFVSLGLLIWALKNISLSNALRYGAPLLVVISSITYFRSNKIQSYVHNYLQEKGATRGILFPIITILQTICFIVFLYQDHGAYVVKGESRYDDYMFTEFKSKTAFSGIFFLMGIRTMIAGRYEKNKASIWIGLGIILISLVTVYRLGISYHIW